MARARAKLPGEQIEVSGREALATWERLRSEGRGWPIIVGGPDDFDSVAEQATGLLDGQTPPRPYEAILSAAAQLRHPEDYIAHVRSEEAEAIEALAKLPAERRTYTEIRVEPDGSTTSREVDWLDQNSVEPEIGEWPEDEFEAAELSVIQELVEDAAEDRYVYRTRERVTLLRLPVSDFSEAPALLRWGGWNACPEPEYHVAALRSWRDRYGAELIAMSLDTLELRVQRQPATRDEALELARELYAYCPDLIDQGFGSFAPLAARLMADKLWSFWWD